MTLRFEPLTVPAILLRKTDYGESDLILTLLSADRGRLSVIAPAAKRSRRRFGGVLEVFNELEAVVECGRGLPRLREASLKNAFARIREDPLRTGYAGLWAELAHDGAEEGLPQVDLYDLLRFALGELDRGELSAELLHLAYLMRLLGLTGHAPCLECCVRCRVPAEALSERDLRVDLGRGGVCCPRCAEGRGGESVLALSRGTAKQLLWAGRVDAERLSRLKTSPRGLREGRDFLERFVIAHFGRIPRALEVLRQLRDREESRR